MRRSFGRRLYSIYFSPLFCTKYRALFYLCESVAEDVETQRRGITFVIYNVGNFVKEKYDSSGMEHTITIQNSVPLKTCSLHYCFNDSGFRSVINLAIRFFPENLKSRVRVHFGTHLECSYSLMTFGCPAHSLPVSIDGDLKKKAHLEFIKMRYQQETRVGLPRIVVPTHNDVLFGRGTYLQELTCTNTYRWSSQNCKQANHTANMWLTLSCMR